MALLHPSTRRLREWLETPPGAEPDAGVEEHVSHCERCADELEALDATAEVGVGETSEVRVALQEVLAPPTGLEQRMEDRIEAALLARRDLKLLAGLMGVSIETTRLLMEPPEEPRS
ncbi:MAG TPA: hypothetical protein ENI86_14650 [Acidimicrobiales bacterium]|nr:hypothetical protein [Acidimicrobiales bacterium]